MTPDAPQIPIKIEEWEGEIAKARAARKQVSVWWDANLEAYAPSASDNPETYGDEINTNRDFTLVERKKADLFYQRPDVFAVPSPLFEGKEALLETHTKILNEKLGLHGINARAMAHRVIFDILCTSGMGWTAMGFESSTVPVDMQVPGQPTAMPGAVLNLQPVPQMITQSVDVPIFERVFWEWFSPKQGLIPAHARTTDSDMWPWIGMEFEVPTRTAVANKWVPVGHKGSTGSPDLHFDHGISGQTGDDVVRGTLIYYKSSLYRDDRPHPQHQTQLILIDGLEEPAVHKDSPYQELDAQGRLTPNSLIGYPIHPGTIRTLTDTAYVPSDCTISRPLVNELNTGRRQMIEQRENTLLRYMYNVDTLPPDALAKIVRSPIGGFIGVPGEAFVGDGAIKEIPHGTWPRENNEFNNYLDNDLARTHAIDAEQSGAGAPGDQTATESQIKQNNVNARMGVERGNFLDWYLRGVTKYSQIAMRLMPTEDAAKIVGPQKAQEWDSWRGQVPAGLAFTALPDSALRTDQAVDRKRAMDEFSFLVNAAGINKLELTKQLLPKIGYSATVLDLNPPAPHPEPTKPNFSFKGEDLNPLAPQFAIVMEILRQAGVTISPQAVQEAQSTSANALLAEQAATAHASKISSDTGNGAPPPSTEHGGKLPALESLSKHAAALTGGLQGTGQPAPMGVSTGVQ